MKPVSLYARIAALAATVLLLAGAAWKLHHSGLVAGRAEVRQQWDAAVSQARAEALVQAQANAEETARRLRDQQRNQEIQNAALAQAQDDARRNARDAERVRQQSAAAADIWSRTLRNSPTAADLQAAGEAIRVSADLLGRADRRAGILAAYADAARETGLKCERDYDSLAGEVRR